MIMENTKFTIDLSASRMQAVSFTTSEGNLTKASVTVIYNGEQFTRTAADLQPELRELCRWMNDIVADYLRTLNRDAYTYTGHSYHGDADSDGYAVVIKYYFAGHDGNGVGQALPKTVFEKTAFHHINAARSHMRRIDELALQLFAGWTPQLSLFGNPANMPNIIKTELDADQEDQQQEEGGVEQETGTEPVQADNPAKPAPPVIADKKTKPAKPPKANTPFQVVEADPSDDLPTIINQPVSREVTGNDSGVALESDADPTNIAVNQ